MLRLAFNKQNISIGYSPLYVDALSYGEGNDIVMHCENHGMISGEKVKIERTESSGRFTEEREVTVIDNDSFSVGTFPDLVLSISSIENKNIGIGFDDDGQPIEIGAFDVFFNGNSPFLFPTKFGLINTEVHDNYYSEYVVIDMPGCVNDFVLYNGLVYQASGITKDNKYLFPNELSECFNNHGIDIIYEPYLAGTEPYAIEDGYMLVLPNGREDRNVIRFYYDSVDTERYAYLMDMFSWYSRTTITTKDERFFTDIDGVPYFRNDSGITSVNVYKEDGSYKLTIPLLTRDEKAADETRVYTDFVEQTLKPKSINKIVDYEKVRFEPVYYTGDEGFDEEGVFDDNLFHDLSKLEFILHFRERYNTDTESWITDESRGWNNFFLKSNENGVTLERKYGIEDSDADLLSYLGYNDADIYYRRNKLKKSFIRLSFYDTPNRRSQKLLFYSTIFLDSGELYGKYIKARVENPSYDGMDDEYTVYVSDEHVLDGKTDLRLSASFSTYDGYDLSHSSDGFYLYMFPTIVRGTEANTIYMKVEFNHAKYGRIIPFVLPCTQDGYQTIHGDYTALPINYMLSNDSGEFIGTDWDKLENDMYIKVNVKYDAKKKRYVWFYPFKRTPEKEGHDTQTTVLYEPRITGYEDTVEDTIPEDNVSEPVSSIKFEVTMKNMTEYDMPFMMLIDGVAYIDENVVTSGYRLDPTPEYDTLTETFNYETTSPNINMSFRFIDKSDGITRVMVHNVKKGTTILDRLIFKRTDDPTEDTRGVRFDNTFSLTDIICDTFGDCSDDTAKLLVEWSKQ